MGLNAEALQRLLAPFEFEPEVLDYLNGSAADIETSTELVEMVATFAHDSISEPNALLKRFEAQLEHEMDILPSAPQPVRTTPRLAAFPEAGSSPEPSIVNDIVSDVAVQFFTEETPDAVPILSKKERRKQRKVQDGHVPPNAAKPHGTQAVISCEQSRFHQDATTTSRQIKIRHIDMHFTGHPPLLQQAELRISPNHRYGLLGKNGCGKTTFLAQLEARHLKGLPDDMSILSINQEVLFDDADLVAFVLQGDSNLQRLRATYARLTSDMGSSDELATLDTVVAELQLLDGLSDKPELKAGRLLAQMGFSESQIAGRLHQLSGGWRMKAAFARALYCNPELLLLDEPNNHLDLAGIMLLEHVLLRLSSCVLIVSHDASFLDNVTTDTIIFENRRLTYFSGCFSAYIADQEEMQKKQQRLYDNQERKRQQLQDTIQRATVRARKTGDDKVLGLAASRKKKLQDRLGAEKTADGKRWRTNTRRDAKSLAAYESQVDGGRVEVAKPKLERELKFKILVPPELLQSGSLLTLDNATFRYAPDTEDIICSVSFSIDLSSRIGIVGNNGCGKSTLIKLMLGLILPQSGRVDRVRQATFALYSQHHLDAMDLTTTPLQHMQQRFSEARVQELRNHLGAFGVADICHRPLHVCSGGQRTRVVLATLTYMQPHVLILDEPTNNLDMESIAALESMLAEAACAVVVVSHNRSFLQSTVKELYQLEQGVLQRLEDLKGYTCKLQQQAEQMLGADKYLS